MSTTKQQFFGEIRMRFYLRNPYSTRPCMIFVGTNIGGKFYRASAQVKVYPSHWDSKRQLAVISNVQSIQDNRNNKIVNDQLSKLRRYFSEFIEYICNNDVDDIGETLKLFIYRDMAKKRKLDLKQVIAEALEYYHKYVKPSIKDSTKRQNESLLSEFGRFVDSLPEKDKSMQIFSQKGMNRYKQYLIDKMERSKTDDKMRNFGVGMLNRCGAIIALLINRVLVEKEDDINPVVWNKVDDPRREDQIGHIPLLDNEVKAIENCSGLTDAEKEYRNLFLLQLECGQRVSDVAKILTGKYKVEQGKKYKYIVLSTIKENIKAYVPLTPRMTMLLEKVKAHELVDPKEFEEKTKGKGNNTYNEAIRRIAKKADLDREIVKINASQTEVRKLLYETITSHDARCTFITNMIKKGVSPDRLCKMTGHASDEMIKRVYAQLSDADEINRIESDLYSDVDDDKFTDALSNHSNESETINHKEETATMPIYTDSEPSSFFQSNEYLSYGEYIKKLNDYVDMVIEEMSSINPGYDDILASTLQEERESYRSSFELKSLDSEEKITEFWQEQEANLKEAASQDPDNPIILLDLDRLNLLKSLIDYLKDNHVEDVIVGKLENIFNEICEENPNAYFVYRMIPKSKVLLPISRFSIVFSKTMTFIHENRPLVDDSYVNDKIRALKGLPKLKIVFRELQITPIARLEMLVSSTSCSTDNKRILYDSVVNGDYNIFTRTIQACESEIYLLIQYAYTSLYSRIIKQMTEYVITIAKKGTEGPLDMIDNYRESLLIQNPFIDNGIDEESLNFFEVDFREIDYEEYMLRLLDHLIIQFDRIKKIAYPQERKVFDRIISIVDFNKHPELKVAYEDYKARQNVASGSERPIEQVDIPEDKKEENPEEPKEQKTVPNYLPSRTNNIDIDELVRLLTQKDKLNNNHIFVTLVKCDSGEADVATCLKHFLDYTSSTLSYKLRWNDKNKVSLKFLIRLLFNTNGKATIRNVIEKDAKKAYDGISDKVSTGQGGFPIWPSVIEVFENCPKSIEQAGLGDEGSDAREYNLKQLRTIAKMYFACRKDSSKKT